MTVKCIKQEEKEYLLSCYSPLLNNVDQLMQMSGRSRRTVVRLLEEAGHQPVKHRRPNRKAKEIALPPQLTVVPTKTPWYRRVIESVKRPFV